MNDTLMNSDMDEPARKKVKACCAEKKEILDIGNIESQSDALREKYLKSNPYLHIQIENICDEELLQKVEDELVENLRANYKETDLFKVYQVPEDLASLESEKMPNLVKFRDALYSEAFRKIVEKITGCKKLSERVDCSANAYAEGGHLLCHDDVIGSRAVSYILYLTDEDWNYEKDGGSIELYQTDKNGEPLSQPVVRINPTRNSLLMFQVVPGKSFHAVQEVYCQNAPRLSISGWFHYANPDTTDNYTKQSSREQQRQGEIMQVVPWFLPGDLYCCEQNNFELTETDIAELCQFIKPEYTKATNAAKLRATFLENSCMVLGEFLQPHFVQALKENIDDTDLGNGHIPKDNAQISTEWHLMGPPHKQRFLVLNDNVHPSRNAWAQLCHYFKSVAFRNFIASLTGVRIQANARATVRRFRPGLDYSVAYGQNEPARLDLTYCILGGGKARENDDSFDLWKDGEVGGFSALYDTEDDNDENPDVYHNDDDQNNATALLSLPPENNALAVVLRDPGYLRFVKFLSRKAPGSRIDLDIVAEIHPEDMPEPDPHDPLPSHDTHCSTDNHDNHVSDDIRFYTPAGLLGAGHDDDSDEQFSEENSEKEND